MPFKVVFYYVWMSSGIEVKSGHGYGYALTRIKILVWPPEVSLVL